MSSAEDERRVREILTRVKDPEIPVIDILELGILRDVRVSGKRVAVDITPTYSGCPAMEMIASEVREALLAEGFEEVEVQLVYSPAWTTDWITDAGRDKLREYGIAPPGKCAAGEELVLLGGKAPEVPCPHCGSANTRLQSIFGPTSCKAIYFCHGCRQPFEYFKTL